jgi:hypothetical protein
MLIALLPDQVDMHWDILKVAVERSLPPIAINKSHSMNRFLECLLEGTMTCWLGMEDGKIDGFVVTTVINDFCTDTKTLLVYFIFGEASRHVYEDGMETLHKHAKAQGCSFIGGYTVHERLVPLCQSLGCTVQYYVSTEVK